MTEKEVLKIFEERGAFLKGHFKLSSGLHSNTYLQATLVLQYPGIAEKIAQALGERFSKEKIDVVIGPALGGITLAYEVARAVGARGIFAEREEGRMALRRGFSLSKGEKVLVAEDVLTTGGSTKEVIETVKRQGGDVVGAASIIDRSVDRVDLGVRFEALAKIEAEIFEEAICPLCRSNIPVTKPGSRKCGADYGRGT